MGRVKLQNNPSIRRMPSYLNRLFELQAEGVETTSTTILAAHMNLDPIVVRKDFALTGIVGRPGVGFATSELIDAILRYLNWDRRATAVLVGAGSLGTALLGFDEFKRFGLEFVAVFDNDPKIIGKKIKGLEVLDIAALPATIRLLKPTFGVLSVSAASAQETADLLIAQGIRALWNFVNVSLKVPDDVVVQREVLAGGFAVLSAKLRQCGLVPDERERERELGDNRIEITLCMGSACFARGNEAHLRAIERFIEENHCADRIRLSGKCCLGRCTDGPNIVVDGTVHTKVDSTALAALLEDLKKRLVQ